MNLIDFINEWLTENGERVQINITQENGRITFIDFSLPDPEPEEEEEEGPSFETITNGLRNFADSLAKFLPNVPEPKDGYIGGKIPKELEDQINNYCFRNNITKTDFLEALVRKEIQKPVTNVAKPIIRE